MIVAELIPVAQTGDSAEYVGAGANAFKEEVQRDLPSPERALENGKAIVARLLDAVRRRGALDVIRRRQFAEDIARVVDLLDLSHGSLL